MTALAAAAGLAAQRKKAGSDFEYYIRKRIQWLVGEDSSWDAPPSYATLTTRLAAEIDALSQYLSTRLGTTDAPGAYGAAVDPSTPAHTDLADVAKIFVDDAPDIIAERTRRYIAERRTRVRQIVWRAAAVHHDLWKGSDSSPVATLDTVALSEVLDRRLRFVERMKHLDYSQGDRELKWTIGGPTANWRDGMRTVMFEYPFIGLKRDPDPTKDYAFVDPFATAVAAAGFSLDPTRADFINGAFYVPRRPRSELRLQSSGRMRPAAAPYWTRSNYSWNLTLQGQSPSAVFDLFVPSTSPIDPAFEDRWQRHWIFCDHMAAALEVDALRFGLRRRLGSDTVFNDSADDGVTLYVPIPPTGKPDPDDVMDEGDDYFEGAAISDDELQVGDLVIIWNNYFLRTVFQTDFGLENSVISQVQGVDPRKSWLVGHGAPEETYAEFVEGLLSTLQDLMDAVRRGISAALAQDPAGTYLNLSGSNYKFDVAMWAPYGEQFIPADSAQKLQVNGAWWLRVKLTATAEEGSSALSLSRALQLLPKSVAVDTTVHTPPPLAPGHDSDYQESIYIPLSVPKGVRGGWAGYFAMVAADRDAGLLAPGQWELEDVKIDMDWAPGFHYAGPNTKIPVLRPKVRPS